eukprot:15127192-Ditylum_brightwellii.AAC.1
MDSTHLRACKVKLPQSQRFTTSEKDPATISVTALNDDADTPIHPFLKMNNNPPLKPQILSSTIKPEPSNTVNISQPKQRMFTQDKLLQSIRFLKPDKLIKHFNDLSHDTVQIQNLSRSSHLTPGETASLKSPSWTKGKSAPSKHFGETFHCNIGFSPVQAHEGIRYSLLFVGKAT